MTEKTDPLFEPTEDDREANVLAALRADAAAAVDKAEKLDEKAASAWEVATKAQGVLADFTRIRGLG